MDKRLEEEREVFKETLSSYTDYNLVSLMSMHDASNPKNKTARLVSLYGSEYGDMIYEECLEELFRRNSELLKEVM